MKDRPDWSHRWANAEAFYAERDHRTLLEVQNLHAYVNRPVEISVAPEASTDPTIQRIVLVAANLTARWARNIRIVVPDVDLAPDLRIQGDCTLRARVAREVWEADPFAYCRIDDSRTSAGGTLRLRVGSGDDPLLTSADYVVDASGWLALGQRFSSGLRCERRDATVSAAALAGAIGAADLFKRAIGHPETRWLRTLSWCTWEHKVTSAWSACEHSTAGVTDVGNLLLAGVGAIGSALIYILSLGPLQGRMSLLDRDCVDATNLNRSPLFTASNAATDARKTDVARAYLSRTDLKLATINGTWREHGTAISREPFDVWVSLTNEDGAWAEVPFQLPPVVVHGTTTSGWGVGFGRHVPRVDDCTACRLPRPKAEFRGPCAQGEVSTTELQQPVRASLPFLSTVAAALIAAELQKLQVGFAETPPNQVSADFAYGLPGVVALRLYSQPTCRGCQIARLPLWQERGGRGRYAGLSLTA